MSYVGQFELFAIVNIGNGGLSLRHDMIVVNIVGQQTELCAVVAVVGGYTETV